jgi:hypothetical protein
MSSSRPDIPTDTRHEIFEETSEAPVWYLQLWETITSDASDKDLISNVDRTGIIRSVIVTIIPAISTFLLIAPCVNTWETIKSYRAANNKNFDRTLDLVVNILTTFASVAVMASLMAGILYFSPYILLAVLSLGLSYGIFNVVKHAYRAVRAHLNKDYEKRSAELWAIPRHVLLTILNAVALITHLNYAFNIIQIGSAFNLVSLPNGTFTVAEIILYSCGMLMTLGTLPLITRKIIEYNNETYAVLKSPLVTLKNIYEGLRERCIKYYFFVKEQPLKAVLSFVPSVIGLAIEAISFGVKILSRVIAALLAPVHLLCLGIYKGYTAYKEAHPSTAPVKPAVKAKPKATSTTAVMTRQMLATRHAALHQELSSQIDHLVDFQEMTPKRKAKLNYLLNLRGKLGSTVEKYDNVHSLQTIEQEAKSIGPLFQSFWKDEGKVEKIARFFSRFDRDMQIAGEASIINIKKAVP